MWLRAPFLIECKVKGTPGRDRKGTKKGVVTPPKAKAAQTDTVLKFANGPHRVVCCPICGPFYLAWYTEAPTAGAAPREEKAAGCRRRASSSPSSPPPPLVLKWNRYSPIYLQRVLHSSHNTVNYLHAAWSRLPPQTRRGGERRT